VTVQDIIKRLALMLVLVFAIAAFAACDTADDKDTNQQEQEADNAANEAGNSIEEAAEDTGDAVQEAAEAGAANVEQGSEDAQQELSEAGDSAQDELNEAGDQIQESANEANENLNEAAQETGEQLDQATDETGEQLDQVGEEVEQAADEANENLDQAAEETGEQLDQAGEEVEQAADETGQQLDEAGQQLQGQLADVGVDFREWASSTDDELRDAASSASDELSEAGQSAEDEVNEAGDQAQENVEEAGQEAAEEVNEAVQDVADIGQILTVEQPVIVNDRLVIDSAYSEEVGFLVVQNASAEGTPGEVIGYTTLEDGVNNNVGVDIDTTRATATLYVQVYDDVDGDGVFTEGTDTPEMVNEQPVQSVLTVSIMDANDQFVSQPQVILNSVTVQQPTWVVVYAGDDNPNRVIGSILVQEGTTPNVTVPIDDIANVTPALWVMLHPDTGTTGTFDFGQSEDADLPLPEGDNAIGAKIWTITHVRIQDQSIDDSGAITVQSVLSQGPGILVAQTDNDGEPGDVLGSFAVPDGYSQDITIPLTLSGDAPDNIMVVLYADAGTVGQYDEGVDMPVMVNDEMVTATFEVND
jgi:vacuolar-type H+-ATPase subunit H